MKSIEELIKRCDEVVTKWAQMPATMDTVADFAGVFDLEMNMTLAPKDVVPAAKPGEETQYELFNEMTAEDRFAMKSWRENNGLVWR